MIIRGEAMRRGRSRSRSALPQQEVAAAAPSRDSAARLAARRALGLGALASLFALISRSSARAADALMIDSDGVAHFNGKRNFFTDEEGAGDLRVGADWGVPGIYSQKGAVAVGSVNNNIWLNGKVGIGNDKNQPSQSLDVAGTIASDNFAASGTVTAGTVKAASLETNSGISLAAVQSAVNILIPVGTIIAYGGDTRNDTIVTTLRGQGWCPATAAPAPRKIIRNWRE